VADDRRGQHHGKQHAAGDGIRAPQERAPAHSRTRGSNSG
jgi:hypothetical protein